MNYLFTILEEDDMGAEWMLEAEANSLPEALDKIKAQVEAGYKLPTVDEVARGEYLCRLQLLSGKTRNSKRAPVFSSKAHS